MASKDHRWLSKWRRTGGTCSNDTLRVQTPGDIHRHISPWQQRVVFDEVQFFGDSLLSHEEYLHSHKWRAVNKLPCGEPQSHRTFSCREGSDQEGRQSFSPPSCSNCSHGSITFSVLYGRHCSLAYLCLAQLLPACTCCRVQISTEQPHVVLATLWVNVNVAVHQVRLDLLGRNRKRRCVWGILWLSDKFGTLPWAVPHVRQILIAFRSRCGY